MCGLIHILKLSGSSTITGLDWWTRLVDWTGGLDWWTDIFIASNKTHLPVGLYDALC